MGNDRIRLMLVMAGYLGFGLSIVLPWEHWGGRDVYGYHYLLTPFWVMPILLWTGESLQSLRVSWTELIPVMGLLWAHLWILSSWVHWWIPTSIWRRIHGLMGLSGLFAVQVGWWGEMTPESVRFGFVIWGASVVLVTIGLLSRDWRVVAGDERER